VKAVTDSRPLAKFLYDEVPDYSYIRGIPSQMGQFVSMANGFRGSNVAVYGETGVHGLGALSLATRLIGSGEVDSVMIVGVSPKPSVTTLVPLDTEEPLAQKAATGSGPFDSARQGTLVGQGAAALLLERESTARARGVRVLARLDGCQVLTTTDRRDSLRAAVATVLGRAGAGTGLWFAGANGSPTGDRDEFDAVQSQVSVPVTSTRGTIGTAFETAGLIDVAMAVESLRRYQAPPIGLLSAPDPSLAGLYPTFGSPTPLAPATGVLVTAWNHGDSSGSAGAAFISPGGAS
jgi:3-oxoacyl-[acyl-carrier-protein] synthase II